MNTDLGQTLRELGDDTGRPVPAGEEILSLGKRARRRNRAVRVGIAATTCAALAIAVPTVGLFGRAPETTATASTYLRDVAARVPSEAPTGARYWRSQYEAYQFGSTKDNRPFTGSVLITTWHSRVGMHVRHDNGDVMQSSDRPPLFGALNNGGFTWDELDALPADPSALRRAIEERAGGREALRRAGGELRAITSLASAPVRPEVRGALFTLAAETEGIELAGAATDTRGRPGTALEQVERDYRFRVILTDDGTVLEHSFIALKKQHMLTATAEPGEVTDRTTYVSNGPADSLK